MSFCCPVPHVSAQTSPPRWAGHGRLPEECVQVLSVCPFVLGRTGIGFLIRFLSTLSPAGRTGLPVHKLALPQHEPHRQHAEWPLCSSEHPAIRELAQDVRHGDEPGLTSHHSFKASAYPQSTLLRPSRLQGTSLAITSCQRLSSCAFPLLLPSFAPPSCGLQQKPLNLLFLLYKQLICSQFR